MERLHSQKMYYCPDIQQVIKFMCKTPKQHKITILLFYLSYLCFKNIIDFNKEFFSLYDD